VVKSSENKLSWSYLALFLEDVSQRVIQIDLQLHDNLTKLHPVLQTNHTYHIISSDANKKFVLVKRLNTFVISIG
jgi:hypothetical protein